MALPRLNDTIKYEVIIPSTQQTVKFRPYLVKEEKVLLAAFESKDEKQTVGAVVDTIEACIYDPIDKRKLTTFDIEYLFMQIRSKSVGETSKVLATCESCDLQNEVVVDVSKISVEMPSTMSGLISINDDIAIEMRYPSYMDFAKFDFEQAESHMVFEMVATCIDAIISGDDRIMVADEPAKEVKAFLESMTAEQFSRVAKFLQEIPSVETQLDFSCESCGHHNSKTVKGMQNFF